MGTALALVLLAVPLAAWLQWTVLRNVLNLIGAHPYRAQRELPNDPEILFFRNRGLAGGTAGTRGDEVRR